MNELTPFKNAELRFERHEEADQSSDSQDVARELERAKGQGRIGGLFALWRLRHEASLEESMKVEILRKLVTRKAVAEQQTATVTAEIALKKNLHTSKTEDQKNATLFNKARRERLLSDLEVFARHETLTLGTDGSVRVALSASASSPPLSPHISEEHIEALVLRAVVLLATENGGEDGWPMYRADLYRALPPNIAQEVERRILEKRELLR